MFGSKVKTTILIEGMHCGHCSSKVKEALEGIEMIDQATVSEETGKAVIRSKEVLDEVLIEKKIGELGFKYKGIVE